MVVLLPLSMVLESAQVFYGIRTVGNGTIQSLGVDCMWLDVFYAMVCTKPSIIGINHGVVKQIINQLLQDLLQKIGSLSLIPSSVSTVKGTTKQIVTNILIGITVSIKSGMVENDRSSLIVEYSNVAILSYLVVVYFSFFIYFSIYILFAHQYIVARGRDGIVEEIPVHMYYAYLKPTWGYGFNSLVVLCVG